MFPTEPSGVGGRLLHIRAYVLYAVDESEVRSVRLRILSMVGLDTVLWYLSKRLRGSKDPDKR